MSSAQAHSYLTGKARVQGPASGNAGSHIDLCCDMMDFLASTDACSSLADALADGLNHQSEQTLPTAAKKGGKKGGKAGTKSRLKSWRMAMKMPGPSCRYYPCCTIRVLQAITPQCFALAAPSPQFCCSAASQCHICSAVNAVTCAARQNRKWVT
jgi:hypothetical protein